MTPHGDGNALPSASYHRRRRAGAAVLAAVLPLLPVSCALWRLSRVGAPAGGAAVHVRATSSAPDGLLPDVPACARDVFVALRPDGDADAGACPGLLLRDDLVVAGRACLAALPRGDNATTLAFALAGFGTVRATPRPAPRALDPRLGLLAADPPFHQLSIHDPVRRTLAFVGRGNGTDGAVATCGDRGQPLLRSLPADGAAVPLDSLRDALGGEGALWEEDLVSAARLEFRSHAWWSRPIDRTEAEEQLRRLFARYRGPPGSASFVYTRDDFVGRAAALAEIVDPRGHRWHGCFRNYLRRWRREDPFGGGLPFFEWLDFGPGKFLLEERGGDDWQAQRYDRQCKKKHFNREKIRYFDAEERRRHEVYLAPSDDGARVIARYKLNDEPVPRAGTGGDGKEGPYMYNWDLHETLYLAHEDEGEGHHLMIKHTGMLAGAPVLSAGVLYVQDGGAVDGVTFSSGHYRPDVTATALLWTWTGRRGLNRTALRWIGRADWGRGDWSEATCREADWGGIDLPGYEGGALERACREVTRGPTWVVQEDVRRGR